MFEQSRCEIHGTFEDIDDPYIVCGECGHVYRTARELEDADYVITAEWDMAADILICPLCTHDF